MASTESLPPPSAAGVLHRERVSDPDLWLAAACWAVVAFAVAQILMFGFGRDQTIYAVVGEGVANGKMPYRDLWDFKPPGIFIVYGLADVLFRGTMMAPRILEALGLVGMVFGFQRLAAEFTDHPRAGLVGGALAALIHAQLEFWHTGQPESFGGFITVWALLLLLRDDHRRRAWLSWALGGALFGFTFLLKPPLGGAALVGAAYLSRRARIDGYGGWRVLLPFVAVGGGAAVVILGVGLWFVATGAWPDFSWTMFTFTPGYTQMAWGSMSAPEAFYYALRSLFDHFSALIPLGIFALLLLHPMHSREREGILLIAGILAIHVAGVALQAKFFQYHYGASLPLIAFLAGLGLYKLWRRFLLQGAAGVVAFSSTLFVVGAMQAASWDLRPAFWERSRARMAHLVGWGGHTSRADLDDELYRVADYSLGANQRVAALVRQLTPAGAPIYVWGFEPGLYWLSQRPPASRFIYNVPQRASWGRDLARQRLLEELREQPPEAIIVQHGDRFAWVTGVNDDSAEALPGFPSLYGLVQRGYELRASLDGFDIYLRRRAAPIDG